MLHVGNGLQQLRGMEPGDIPLSAVDFHISNILENLLNNRDIITAALAAGRDPLQIMRDAIWLFSSSINARTWVQVLSRPLYSCGSHFWCLECTQFAFSASRNLKTLRVEVCAFRFFLVYALCLNRKAALTPYCSAHNVLMSAFSPVSISFVNCHI